LFPLTQAVKKLLYVGTALGLYSYYCHALALSAIIQMISLMYVAMVRPFKSPWNNVIIIFEEFMMLVCILVLFRFANYDSVQSLDNLKSSS
jgi:hypothetical protein